MTDYLSKCVSDWGIDVYRHDRGLYPYFILRDYDAPDRQGIMEIRYVEGLYAMWDELLKRHPGLIIDNSNWRATGPDLEMVKRSAGSWTCSEAKDGRDPVYNQQQLMGLSLYLPIHGSILFGTDPYTVRSVARFGATLSTDTRSSQFSAKEMKRASDEVKSLRELYLGDYYPLIPADLGERHWCGWQFDRPDLGQGFVMCFRRPESPYPACEITLKGLEPAAQYEVTFSETYDVKTKRIMTGKDLVHFKTEIGKAPGSLLIRYIKH
jgi:alpha-galactosidase